MALHIVYEGTGLNFCSANMLLYYLCYDYQPCWNLMH